MSTMSALPSGGVRAHATRLRPGDDLVPSLVRAAQRAMEASGASSAFVLSAVGSVNGITLRMASACRVDDGASGTPTNEIREWKERLEIVSLSGTFSREGKHLHCSVSDSKLGQVWGGHLMAGKVFTTLELVIGTIEGVCFQRVLDDETGYTELVVTEHSTDANDEQNS